MKRIGVQIITWLGIVAVLTLIAMSIWLIAFGQQTTESLKWLQLLQTIGTFLLPPILCAWMWDENHNPVQWLKLHRKVSAPVLILAIAIMVCAIPGINLLADLNGRVVLPKSLESIELFLRQQEQNAALLTEQFLKADNVGILLINIGLMALLPAFAEELSFRGTLQQILSPSNFHLAIWITAFLFSAIHMQFYGFIPRMLMGAMFGYVFVWTGSLWVPILMHFINNGIAVIAYYVTSQGEDAAVDITNYADTIGAGTTWWVGVLSLTAVGVLLWRLHIRVH